MALFRDVVVLGLVALLVESVAGLSKLGVDPPTTAQCTAVTNILRFDCYPEDGATEELCNNRGCCWLPPTTAERKNPSLGVILDIPYCYYPTGYGSYELSDLSDTSAGKSATLKRNVASYIPNDINTIQIDAKFESQTRLHVRLYDPANQRWEPPLPQLPQVAGGETNTDYEFVMEESKIGFQVVRKSTKEVLFNTQDVGGFIFADQFIQMSALLPSNYTYGLGEHRASFPLNMHWQRFTMWNRDQGPSEYTNLYGTHPFYLSMETSNNAHGVLLFNSNGMDVLLQPTPAITYRTVGGILDMYFLMGPTPADVVKQYTELIGRPFIPPYWGLGFHLCRYGYADLADTKAAMTRTQDAGIPLDTQWNDLDYMENQNDFTYDTDKFAGLPDFVDELHQNGMHYIPLIDPGVSGSEASGTYPPYDRGVELGVFIKDSSGTPFLGKVWNPVSTVWPDFTHPDSITYWKEMLQSMYDLFEFDGAWIDMNEPANFLDGSTTGCANSTLNSPPYTPAVAGGSLISRTVCMDADQYAGKHYNLHNMYGFTEAIVTSTTLKDLTYSLRTYAGAVPVYVTSHSLSRQMPVQFLSIFLSWVTSHSLSRQMPVQFLSIFLFWVTSHTLSGQMPVQFLSIFLSWVTSHTLSGQMLVQFLSIFLSWGTSHSLSGRVPVQFLSIYLSLVTSHTLSGQMPVQFLSIFLSLLASFRVLAEIRAKRPFVISRSSFVGMGVYSGHWSGDITSSWSDMAWTVPELLSMSLFGIPLMGADICGFNGDTTVPLCQRWMELGAFYPFSRNHNGKGQRAQDPASLGDEVVTASKKALLVRYSLLPYLYTLFYKAHSQGETVVRPIFFEFPSEESTYRIDTAFMWGPGLLIAPVLQEVGLWCSQCC
uniref:P-type domain-containing protein n=1 Tax=Timema bartmani TaxID=61472 RepID=A0A7R9F5W6_9NEOP|nr:unnamed protein product [Timema bartmani]